MRLIPSNVLRTGTMSRQSAPKKNRKIAKITHTVIASAAAEQIARTQTRHMMPKKAAKPPMAPIIPKAP